MNQYRKIDLAAWPRRDFYEFYRKFDLPCFSVSIKLNADPIYAFAKAGGESFFLMCLYVILRAANRVPQVRQRIEGGEVVEYEQIAAMTPILMESGMFQEIWCEYAPDFVSFKQTAVPLVEQAKSGKPVPMDPHAQDFIGASCVPWLHFESVSQAQRIFGQTAPIITWGKMEDGKIPISVQFCHCFMDGLYVSRFFAEIQHGFETPESIYER